jgi:hypothetical protein
MECRRRYALFIIRLRCGRMERRPRRSTPGEGFGDPELTRFVHRALDQNLDLVASVTRVEQARAAAKGAGARLKPSGALNVQSTSFRQSPESVVGRVAGTSPGFDRNQSYLDLGAAASWEIDLFGGLRHGGQAAVEEVRVAEAERLGTRVLSCLPGPENESPQPGIASIQKNASREPPFPFSGIDAGRPVRPCVHPRSADAGDAEPGSLASEWPDYRSGAAARATAFS